jgi:3-deoxy-D-manno-octulosonic-acid transferase
MNPLYNIAIGAYSFGVKVAARRNTKAAAMVSGQRQTFKKLQNARQTVAPDGFDVWFHAASLGEFEQARPMIEMLKEQRPSTKILLSFFSPSGYEVRENYRFADTVVYLPFDKASSARRFVELARPKMAIFVKYEFWGNYLEQLKAHNVPTYIISAIFRPKQVFFKPWGGMFRSMLRYYTHLYLQDQASADLLATIGVTNVTVAGDTRFDRVTQIMETAVEIPALSEWKKSAAMTIVCGSSWGPDEDRYIDWLNANPSVKAIIAPHQFDESRIAALMNRLKGKTVRWTKLASSTSLTDVPSIDADPQVIILDCFGILSSIYRYGDVAIIGGGFGAGIHNICEAAVYDMPVLFGPNNHKFKEAQDLIALGGAHVYTTAADLADVLDRYLSTPATLSHDASIAGTYIRDSIGATPLIYARLFNH